MFDVTIIQAYLLQTCYGFFSGSQKAFQQAELSRGALVIAAKRMHLLRPGESAVEMLHGRLVTPSLKDLTEAEREDQNRARLGWAIYVSQATMELPNAEAARLSNRLPVQHTCSTIHCRGGDSISGSAFCITSKR